MWTCIKCQEQIEDRFTSCWKCEAREAKAYSESRETAPAPILKPFARTVLASALSPFLADCIHSLTVMLIGIRYFEAELADFFSFEFWGFIFGRALVTLLLLIVLKRFRWPRKAVWLGCTALWIWLNIQREAMGR